MTRSIYLLFSIIFVVLICSCEPKDKYYYVNQESKEWALFKPGSWWVYQDSAAKTIDSVSITQYDDSFSVDYSDKKNLHFQNINYSVTGDGIINFTITLSTSTYYSFLNKEMDVNNIAYSALLTYFDPIPRNTALSTVEVLPYYEVNSVVYENVLHIRAGYSEKSDVNNVIAFPNDYWLAKGKGFIKMVDRTPTDTTVWLLQKYNTIQ